MHLTPRSRRRLVIAAIIIAAYSVIGFLVLPPIIRSQAETRASAMLGRRVTIESMRLNPFALSVTVRNFTIWEKDGTGRFIAWRRLYVNFDALASLWREWALSDVELDGLYVHGVVNADQSFNFSDLLTKLVPPTATPPTDAKPGRPLRIGHLGVTDAKIEAADLSRHAKFETTFGPLSFELTNFRTVAERGAPYRFEAVSESGEKLAWVGTLRAEPFQSTGELRIENIRLPKYAPYYADQIQADIASGMLSVRGTYALDLTKDHRVMTLSHGAVELRDVAIKERGGTDNVIELPRVEVSEIDADALAQKAAIQRISVTGGQVRARREPSGAINLLTMLQPPAKPAPTTVTASPTGAPAPAPQPSVASPKVSVGEIAVKGFAIEVRDLAAPRLATCALTNLQLTVHNATLEPGAKLPVQLAFDWAPQGAVQLDGTVGLNPAAADVKVQVTRFALLPLSPYLEQFANVHLTEGTLSTTLAAAVSTATGKPAAASLTGDLSLDHIAVVDAAANEDLASVGTVALRGLRASSGDTTAVTINEIRIEKPHARVAVGADGALNLAKVAVAAPRPDAQRAETTTKPAPAPSPTAAPAIEIGKVLIADGDFRFADNSLTPGVSTAMTQFGGIVSGLSSTRPGKGDVDLKAVVDGAGPVLITGNLDPFGATPKIDLKVDVKNVDLLPVSPYTGKYAGYALARGKLFADVKVRVEGKKIDAANVITLNQFTFGDAVQSPDATKLPVRLAVALLKDIDGKIVIDVPIQGNTDDPEFKIGRVVVRVLVNLLTKAAVSPFALLGSAFGGGGDELAYQEFSPGSADLQPAEVKKLETLVKALTNRPGLNLDLEGSYDQAADSYALKRAKLADRIRRMIWEEKHKQDPNIAPPEQLVITPEENAAAIKTLFDQTFPPGTQFGTPVPPPPAVTAPPAPPPGGWMHRVLRALTFADRRAARKAAEENAQSAAAHDKAVAAAVATGLPVDEMLGRLAEATPIDDNDLRALAQARAQRVRDYFRDLGKIDPERLFLAKMDGDATKQSKGPRVFLTLQ